MTSSRRTHPQPVPRLRRGVAVGLGAALVLAGCSAGPSDPAPESDPAPSSATSSTAPSATGASDGSGSASARPGGAVRLAFAGDVHILLGGGCRGSTYVDVGLGNVEFYVSGGGPTAETGVLVLTARGRDISRARWVPGRIEGGVPVRLQGAEAAAALQRKTALRGCAGLTARPGPTP